VIDVRGLHHLGLTVADLDAYCAWSASAGYGPPERFSVTGADGAIGNGLPSAALDIAFVSAPRLTLELVSFDPSAGWAVGPLDRAFGSVPAWSLERAGDDPDGRPVIAGTDPTPLRVTSADPARTAHLLGLLGFAGDGTGSEGAVVGHGVRVEIVSVAEGRLVPANAPGRVHLCCEVADMDCATAELADRGYGLVSTPRVHGDLSWVFVRHPEGPGVELLSIGANDSSGLAAQ
jgi:hypothetical protein